MNNEIEPIQVAFPLKGEWCAVNTPGEKIPSHGTHQLGQTYAFDFLQIDWNKDGYRFFDKSVTRGVIFGVRLSEVYCWSKPIFSPFDGEVVETSDGFAERDPVHVVRDLFTVIRNGIFLRANSNKDLQRVLGNYIILKNGGVYCLLAHAKCGSIQVKEREYVQEGQVLANVGHSGNSTTPHLHFQLMDRSFLLEAKGLPCCFTNLQTYTNGVWKDVKNYIPGKRERVNA